MLRTDRRLAERTRGTTRGARHSRWVLVVVLLALTVAMLAPAVAVAASSGPNYGSGTSVDTLGADVPWADPGNIGADDASYATSVNIPIAGGTSYLLVAGGFGFAIPDGATIDGIQVKVNRMTSANPSGTRDAVVQLTRDGSAVVGSNLADAATNWPTRLTTASYGGAGALWGTTWTPAEVNAAGFGVALQAVNQNSKAGRVRTATVDFIRVTVTYTVPVPLTVSAAGVEKVYDATAVATVTLSSADIVPGDEVTLAYTGAAFADKHAGAGKPVSVEGISIAGADAGKYALQNVSAETSATITPAALSVAGALAADKVYDGATGATVDFSAAALVGVLAGDEVTLDSPAYSAAFATKDAGLDKPVAVSGLALSGADAGNYALAQPELSAAITPAGLTVDGALAADKVYDGTTDATVDFTAATLAGVVAGEDVSLDAAAAIAAFATRDVGADKPVSVAGLALAGADAGNYTLAQPELSAAITPAELSVDGALAADKVYDGTTDAAVDFGAATLVGVLTGEDVRLDAAAASAAFATKDVGADKPVSVAGLALAGADAGNYTLAQPELAATVTARDLAVTASGLDKVYDGTTTAGVTLDSDALAGDHVTIDVASATFATKDVGADRPVAVDGISIDGADAGNYDLQNMTAETSAAITPKGLTITAVDQTKLFGTTFIFTGTEFTATGLVPGDTVATVSLASNGAPASAVAGTYPIVAGGATGTGLGNYAPAYVDGTMTVAGGYRIGPFAKPLRSSDARRFHRGSTIRMAFKIKDPSGTPITTAKPRLRLRAKGTVVWGPRTVKYDSSRGMYIYRIRTTEDWKLRTLSARVTLGAGATGRTVYFRIVR